MSVSKLDYDQFLKHYNPHIYFAFEGITHELILDFQSTMITLWPLDADRNHHRQQLQKRGDLLKMYHYSIDEEKRIVKIYNEKENELIHFEYVGHFRYNPKA